MDIYESFKSMWPALSIAEEAVEYFTDACQKSILFTDILRKRGNNYFKHLALGQPPVLIFDYKMVLDGRTFEKPVNYALVKIIDRRRSEGKEKTEAGKEEDNRRVNVSAKEKHEITTLKKRPILIIDPRAGHGPGIGGSKRDSEIGMAINHGHTVYFVIFFTNPEPGQALVDVHNAEVMFLEEIVRLHPYSESPAVIGNCQGGWAAALIGADRPDITGPLVLNGSPLSYWAGVEGRNPMRYKGGLVGGTWLVSLCSDLGYGKFDGANLVAGFEELNPSNTLWKKEYNLYTNVDTEGERYLDFEKWWGGFFFTTTEEIYFIIDSLFVGNRLEKGLLDLDKNTRIDLKNIEEPILVFASEGDNITPPQQALNWIVKVWGSVDEIKKQCKVIVYLLHETIGHLGIFVSGNVSRKEHNEIIGSINLMGYLSPGLYEMVIEEGKNSIGKGDYAVRFEERDMCDILSHDDGLSDEEDFRTARAVSNFNDKVYSKYFRPFVNSCTNEFSAETIRQMHPLRVSRYLFSDLNPFIIPFSFMAEAVNKKRMPVSKDNFFLAREKDVSENIGAALDGYRDFRDQMQETYFRSVYGNPFLKMCFKNSVEERIKKEEEEIRKGIKEREKAVKTQLLDDLEKGGFVEGALRIMAAMAGINYIYDQKKLIHIRDIVKSHNVFTDTSEPYFKKMIRKQARIFNADNEKAIKTLRQLIKGPANRLTAIQIAESMLPIVPEDCKGEKKIYEKIKEVLYDKKTL